jgi:four helix bundle protein
VSCQYSSERGVRKEIAGGRSGRMARFQCECRTIGDMRSFENLAVWRRAHALAIAVEESALRFPRRRFTTLVGQLTRSAESIAANIVEGSAAATQKEFARYLDIAIKSTSETQYHLLAARDRGALPAADWQPLNAEVIEIRRMTFGLRKRILSPPQ